MQESFGTPMGPHCLGACGHLHTHICTAVLETLITHADGRPDKMFDTSKYRGVGSSAFP